MLKLFCNKNPTILDPTKLEFFLIYFDFVTKFADEDQEIDSDDENVQQSEEEDLS